MTAMRQQSAGTVELGALLQPWLATTAGAGAPISTLTLDSREVEPGALFLALPGATHHGLAFAGQAVAAGAAAVAWDEAPEAVVAETRAVCEAHGVVLQHVPKLRERAGEIAARFYGQPSETLPVVGITGTDGKTSVSQFLAQALAHTGRSCGVVGTLGYGFHGRLLAGTHTTPDAVQVHQQLATLCAEGADAVAMEVSSHALDQHRVAGVRFDCAVLTNLSRDHLDYHGTEAAYAEAKARLFETPGLRAAVLNVDDAFGRSLVGRLAGEVHCLRYSLAGEDDAELVARAVDQDRRGLSISAEIDGQSLQLDVPLLGRFNAANVMASAGALLALGMSVAEVQTALSGLRSVPGRMERFGVGDGPEVVIDYAHTPAALEAALTALRAHFPGALWCVFGCGGDRDRGKRPLMGAVAGRCADHVILTDDNPRSECSEQIVEDIRAGIPDNVAAEVIHDRQSAIAAAVEGAGAGDVVLIAGKGHEDYQIVGDERRAFSDRATVEALRGGRP